MKKTVAKILVLAMVLTMALGMVACGGGGEDSPYVGTWNMTKFEMSGISMTAEEAGLSFTVDIKADGSVTATTNGEDDGAGTWEETDDGITITDATGSNITAKLDGDELILNMENDGITFYLTKE